MSLNKPSIQAILMDMDGVLYHGDQVIADAIPFVQAIKNIPHCFITNNPILQAEKIVTKLHRMGFTGISKNQIITSAQATSRYLDHQKSRFKYFHIGTADLKEELDCYGEWSEVEADFVVVGEGEGINFDKITQGINLITKHNAQLISTNPDHSVDALKNGERIILPGGGALVAPFEVATGKTAITIGKPYPPLYNMAMDLLQTDAPHCLMIGDRPDTDILGANQLEMQTALVRTGRFNHEQSIMDNNQQPDWDVNSLSELLSILSS